MLCIVERSRVNTAKVNADISFPIIGNLERCNLVGLGVESWLKYGQYSYLAREEDKTNIKGDVCERGEEERNCIDRLCNMWLERRKIVYFLSLVGSISWHIKKMIAQCVGTLIIFR